MVFGRHVVLVLAFLLFAVGCSGATGTGSNKDVQETRRDRIGSLTGDTLIFGDDGEQSRSSGIAVNGYLWRASLDTVSFFPMAQVDAQGGVIITEWYSLPETPGERFKLTVYILNRELRADGVRVSLFKQVSGANGSWVDAPVAEGSAAKIENAILTRARQLRIDSQATLN